MAAAWKLRALYFSGPSETALSFFANPELSEMFACRQLWCFFQGRKFPHDAPSLHNHLSIYLEIFLCKYQIKCQCVLFNHLLIHLWSIHGKAGRTSPILIFYEDKRYLHKSLNKTLSKCGSRSFLEIASKVRSKIIAWSYSKLYYLESSIFIMLDYSQKPFHYMTSQVWSFV